MSSLPTSKGAVSDEDLHYMLDPTSEKVAISKDDVTRNHCNPGQEHDVKNGNLQKKMKEYMQSFTVHGVSKLNSGTKGETAFWTSIIIIGIMVTSYGIYNLVTKYYTYEIYSALSSKVTNENTFPAITFCDDKRMKKNYFAYCENARNDAYCSMPKKHPKMTNILNGTGRWSNGYFIVRRCDTWGSKDCLTDMYLKSREEHAHFCFTWNYDGNFHDTYGRATISFSLNTSVIKPPGGNSKGWNPPEIVASVHDHQVSELQLMHGVFLNRGKKYTLTIRKTFMKRLPPPFPSKCTRGKPYSIYPGKYTRTSCVDSINYITMLEHCGDTIDYIKRLLSPDLIYMYKVKRNLTKRETLLCMYTEAGKTVPSTGECPVPCDELELTTTTTSFEPEVPSDEYLVDIQLQDVDSYQIITENQVFTWDQLAGGIGGYLGLMIGASLVSLIEILVYVFLCLLEKVIGK